MTPKMNATIERAKKFGIDIFNMTVPEEAALVQRFEHLDIVGIYGE